MLAFWNLLYSELSKTLHGFNGMKYRFGKENIKKYIKKLYQGKIHQTN